MNQTTQAAPLILGLLQEKTIASDSEHASAFDLSIWKASDLSLYKLHQNQGAVSGLFYEGSGAEKSSAKSALWTENGGLFYDPKALAASFLENPEALEKQFAVLCLDAFFQKYGGDSPKAGLCFSGGHGGHSGEHGAGSEKGTAAKQEAAALSRRDTIDYRTLLRRFCVPREEAIPDPDSFDYAPYLYGQMYSGQYSDAPAATSDMRLCLIEPLEYSEVNRLDELAIAIDTSSSCSGALVQRFLEETWSILRQRENFFSRMRLHLIQCDSMIQEHRIFTSAEEWEAALGSLKIQGYGSTDFRPVFELLEDQIAKKEIHTLRALLYFTDGDGIYPRKAPPYETAFVFVNQESIKGKVPDWAHCIVLDDI
ncbi:MAG: VWA-like domain-containing protein [Lachnospiraceae bacterium]|nr:VWA-like domain-containing protein [Lachnospiraceae bacterium]